MFERITNVLAWLKRRLRRRPALPVVAYRIQADRSGEPGAPRARTARAQQGNDKPHGHIGAEEAAEQIFAPRHGEEESYGFARVGPDGTVPHHAELWDRENDSMRVRRRRVMLVTCSGGVVPSAEEIKAVCSECGGVDAAAYRCARCGAILCSLHAQVLQQPEGPVLYCRAHLVEALDEWDTWAAYDLQHGQQPAQNVQPSRPWSPAKYAPQGGVRHG